MEKTYVFGHQKPDTDSVCASIVMSHLRNEQGFYSEPHILSEINKETEFVLDYFNVPKPEILHDVKLQIKDLNYLKDYYNYETDSILKGFQNMTNHGISTTLIVDKQQKFKGIVGMKDIAKDQLSENSDNLITSYSNILEVVNGTAILKFDEEFELKIIAAAYKSTRIIDSVSMNENHTLIVGDRHSVIEYAIQSGIKLIILTGNSDIKEQHLALAKEKKINIIRTAYDSYKVIKIINLCNYISTIIRKTSVTCMKDTDYVTDFVEHANKTKFSYYPVVDKEKKCLGIIRLSDLGEKRKKKVILVDHNSYSQSVEGLEEAEIISIIDHHNIGTVGTSTPINFRNMPVGSTNTILYQIYKENQINIPTHIAGLILSGILSDTLILKSPTTTDLDRDVVNHISKLLSIDYQEYGMKMFKAGTSLHGMKKEQIILNDYKNYTIEDHKITIGQIFTTDISEIKDEEKEYINILNELAENNQCDVFLFAITDIIHNGSYFYYNESAEKIIKTAFLNYDVFQGFYLENFVSRKKQFLPPIMEVMDGK